MAARKQCGIILVENSIDKESVLQNILEIKNLSVGFNMDIENNESFFYVLNNINLSFEEGKIHAVAGESGCGKSVFINTVLRLLPKNAKVTTGEIFFMGQNLLDLKEKDFRNYRGKKISLIPQDPFMSLNPLYTIENQLTEILDNKKDTEIIKAALEKVKIKNINTVLKSYPHELSGGMKQRVIIAVSIILNCDLILADEPTTALDVSVSNSILELLSDLKNLNKTVILITHDLSVVSNYSDTTNIMYLGDIVESAPTGELFKNPMHPYTKALLRALPTKKGQKLENIKGQIPKITQTPKGCKFHPRCEYAADICKNKKPVTKRCKNTDIMCHLY